MLRLDGADTEPVIVPVPAGPSVMVPVTVMPMVWPSAKHKHVVAVLGIKKATHKKAPPKGFRVGKSREDRRLSQFHLIPAKDQHQVNKTRQTANIFYFFWPRHQLQTAHCACAENSAEISTTLKPKMQFTTTKGLRPPLVTLVDNIKPASLVALVSLLLSIGLGIASGASPIAGLRTAIWGGLVVGLAGASPYNIIGPAGALIGLLSQYAILWGPSILPWLSLVSGLMCILAARLNLTRYCLLLPKSVFEVCSN
jgi:hypothetical protein